MDFAEILGALPVAGPAALLVATVIYIAKLWTGAEQRHGAELRRVNELHDAELAELRSHVSELRAAVSALQQELNDERQRRFAIEEELLRLKYTG